MQLELGRRLECSSVVEHYLPSIYMALDSLKPSIILSSSELEASLSSPMRVFVMYAHTDLYGIVDKIVCACDPSTQRQRQEDREFDVSLGSEPDHLLSLSHSSVAVTEP